MTSSENMRSTILESSNTGNAGTQDIIGVCVSILFSNESVEEES